MSDYKGDGPFMGAMKAMLRWEGGYVEHPNDPGGATNRGISLRFYKENIDPMATKDIIFGLTKNDVYEIYYKFWWKPDHPNAVNLDYSTIPYPIAKRLFNFAVNMGQKRANKLLQRAIWSVTGKELVIDGLIGPKTRKALEGLNYECLIAALKSEAAGRYRTLILANPKLKVFEKGWFNRAYSN